MGAREPSCREAACEVQASPRLSWLGEHLRFPLSTMLATGASQVPLLGFRFPVIPSVLQSFSQECGWVLSGPLPLLR